MFTGQSCWSSAWSWRFSTKAPGTRSGPVKSWGGLISGRGGIPALQVTGEPRRIFVPGVPGTLQGLLHAGSARPCPAGLAPVVREPWQCLPLSRLTGSPFHSDRRFGTVLPVPGRLPGAFAVTRKAAGKPHPCPPRPKPAGAAAGWTREDPSTPGRKKPAAMQRPCFSPLQES